MKNKEKIEALLEKNLGTITPKDLEAEGISRRYLTSMVRSGELERAGRGIYITPPTIPDIAYHIQLRNPRCILSYQSALFLHYLTERIPFQEEVTVPQGYNPWRIKDKVIVHRVKKEWWPIGICEMKTMFGNTVRTYNMERTICDLIRDREHQDIEIYKKALRFYVRKKDKDMHRLTEYSKIFGIYYKVGEIMGLIYD